MHEELEDIRQRLYEVDRKIELLLQLARNDAIDRQPPLSATQAAAYLHLSLSRVYCLIAEGRLQPLQRKKYGRILFSLQHLRQYLSQQDNQSP
ncbi:helix-turn-helix domain-containing protein [Chitinophaga polysaccharea]|uniref:helix-turn-helix domain-containing protein n=1 Tax=Chitinophaga polysaccharea TaxID=1293035 RepID=UPI001158D9D9|nr:helix-turn-helix domain-containing protein [Chitinophaga polysaccharea]